MSNENKPHDESDPLPNNRVTWEDDTPEMITKHLEAAEETKFINGTCMHYGYARHIPPGTFGVSFCGAPKKHTHVIISLANPAGDVCLMVVIAYVLGLAIDRTEWKVPVPSPDVLMKAATDVLVALKRQVNPNFAAYIANKFDPTNPFGMGSPATWAEHYAAGAWTYNRPADPVEPEEEPAKAEEPPTLH